MKKALRNERGFSILSMLVLGGVVATAGYLSLNTFKSKMDSAKKESLTRKSSHYKNLIESHLASVDCAEVFPENSWKSNLIVNAEAFQNKNLAETAINEHLELENEEIKITGSKVVTPNGGNGNLVEVALSLNRTDGNNASSRTQKIRMFVDNRACTTALGNSDSLDSFCSSSGGVVSDSGCVYNTKETTKVGDNEYEKTDVQRNMQETLCRIKVETGNIRNLKNNGSNGPPNCQINGEEMLYGCKLESGTHIENTTSPSPINTPTSKDDVSDDVNKLRKEAIKEQSIKIASKFERLKTYVERIEAQSGNGYTTFQQDLINFYTFLYSPTGVFAVVGLNAAALIGGSAVLGVLGTATVIGAPIVMVLVVINVVCTGSKRRIRTRYSCNQGAIDVTSMKIQKRKFGCKWLKCGCHWKDEKEVGSVTFKETLESFLIDAQSGTSGSQLLSGPPDDGIVDQEAAIAAMVAAITAISTVEEYYGFYNEMNNSQADPDDDLSLVPEILAVFEQKEEELWGQFITEVAAIDPSDDNALETLDNMVNDNSDYIDSIISNSVSIDVTTAITTKRNEINT